MSKYFCYIIKSKSTDVCYTGITDNLDKRLKQHNGIISGGAKCTRKYDDWQYDKVMEFESKKDAMSFEWYLKWKKNSKGNWNRVAGIKNKYKRLEELESQFDFNYLDI